MWKSYFSKLILFVMLVTLSVGVSARTPVVSWNPNSEPDLAGYRVYWGKASRQYTTVLYVGNVTERVLSPYMFDDSTLYFFAVTAIDTNSNESRFSNEVSLFIVLPDTTAPKPPTGCTIQWK